jgi:hypothetical protein
VEFAKGVATGFVIGVALIGTSVITLYVRDDTAYERNSARIEKLDAQVQRLEVALTRLAGRVADEAPAPAVPKATPATLTTEPLR